MNKLYAKASRLLARHTSQDLLPLNGQQGIVSFTFDDAPASACTNGANVLEAHGVRGTFYVAGKLTDQLEEDKACHSLAQLKTLLHNGHELGCHSFSHVHCDSLSDAALNDEFERNAAFLKQLGVNIASLNFAYPFGAYSYNSKKHCARRFRSSRITGGGPHIGSADLQMLKTFRLYEDISANSGITTFEEALKLTAQHKGWLIINTHDIDMEASRFGYTPDKLDQAVTATLAAGCQILTVSAAIDYWQKNAGTRN